MITNGLKISHTYWSSVVTTVWPLEPQSLLGPEILAHATYHILACSSTGSSNIIAYFSLETPQSAWTSALSAKTTSIKQSQWWDWWPLSMVFAKANRNQMVPPFLERWGETDNQATTPFGYCKALHFSLFGHIVRMPGETDAEILTASPLENCRRPPGHPCTVALRGQRLSNKTWNPITSPWMKQLTWLITVHSGDWCLRLAPQENEEEEKRREEKWYDVERYRGEHRYGCTSVSATRSPSASLSPFSAPNSYSWFPAHTSTLNM